MHIYEGELSRDNDQRYCLNKTGILEHKIFAFTSGCPLEIWLNNSWIAGHVEGDGENYWFFANKGGKVLLAEHMRARYIEQWEKKVV